MSDHKDPQSNPLLKPLVMVLAGMVFSYTGLFIYGDTFPLNYVLLILGVLFPIAALITLWRSRHVQ